MKQFRTTISSVCGLMAASLLSVASTPLLPAQEVCIRIMAQDSTLNNLVDPPGYATAKPGTLGGVLRMGDGPQAMILIPGLGFSGSVFTEFMQGLGSEYRMYAVTLPGFGGTAAPPSPDPQTSFGKQTWTNAAVSAIEELMEKEKIDQPIVVGHWLTGTQIAVRLAMRHPEKFKAVILLAGSATMMVADSVAHYYSTLDKRVSGIDRWLAPQWFKTVTRETWDDNNFLPGDYAVNPVRGLRLWREAAIPKLHVWVRYLCEFSAQDISIEMENLMVPTLLLKPGLEGLSDDPVQNYIVDFCHRCWNALVEKNETVVVKTIPNSRVCLWFDQPRLVHDTVVDFLRSVP